MRIQWKNNSGIQELIQRTSLTLINKVIVVLALFSLQGCRNIQYLPSSDKIGVNTFGSYVSVSKTNGKQVNGELIAADSNKLTVLSGESLLVIEKNQVRRYTLRYANSKHYGWTIPVFTLVSLFHGIGAAFTAPVNLIVTIAVTVSGENAFIYTDDHIEYESLNMFARFPQGIPAGIDPSLIRPAYAQKEMKN